MVFYTIYKNACAFSIFRTKHNIELMAFEPVKREFSINHCIKVQNKNIMILIYSLDQQFGITEFRSLIQSKILDAKLPDTITELIVVIPIENNDNIKKYLAHAREVIKIPHIFVVGHIFFAQNITLRPDHSPLRVMSREEIAKYKEFFQQTNWEKNIMKMTENDVAARWYGAYRGDIVEASAPSINAMKCITYHSVE